MKNKNYYIYVYLDPRKPGDYLYGEYKFNYEPFYIGKGRKHRLTYHLAPSNLITQSHLKNKINKIRKENDCKPIIKKLIMNLTEIEAHDLEIILINNIKRHPDGPLVNKTIGGEGVSGHKMSAKSKEKMRQSAINRWENIEERDKQAVRAKNMSQEQRDKISKRIKELWKEESYRENQLKHINSDAKKEMSKQNIKLAHKVYKEKLKNPEFKSKLKEYGKKGYHALINHPDIDVIRKKQGQSMKVRWQDEEYRKHQNCKHSKPIVLDGIKYNGIWEAEFNGLKKSYIYKRLKGSEYKDSYYLENR